MITVGPLEGDCVGLIERGSFEGEHEGTSEVSNKVGTKVGKVVGLAVVGLLDDGESDDDLVGVSVGVVELCGGTPTGALDGVTVL